MKQRNATAFATAFGPSAENLLSVLTAEERSGRLSPVDGAALTDDVWTSRFAAAGSVPEYRYAQHEFAIERRLRRLAEFGATVGVTARAHLALLYDRIVTLGPADGMRWLSRVLDPNRPTGDDPAERLRAAVTAPDRAVFDRLLASSALAPAPPAPDGGVPTG